MIMCVQIRTFRRGPVSMKLEYTYGKYPAEYSSKNDSFAKCEAKELFNEGTSLFSRRKDSVRWLLMLLLPTKYMNIVEIIEQLHFSRVWLTNMTLLLLLPAGSIQPLFPFLRRALWRAAISHRDSLCVPNQIYPASELADPAV